MRPIATVYKSEKGIVSELFKPPLGMGSLGLKVTLAGVLDLVTGSFAISWEGGMPPIDMLQASRPVCPFWG